jgi:hypothetical protein
MSLVDRGECCIHHSMLKTYGVSELSSGSDDVVKQIKKCNLIEGIDFLLRRLAEQSETSRGRPLPRSLNNIMHSYFLVIKLNIAYNTLYKPQKCPSNDASSNYGS